MQWPDIKLTVGNMFTGDRQTEGCFDAGPEVENEEIVRRFKARRKPVFFSCAEFNRLFRVQQFYWSTVDCFPEHLKHFTVFSVLQLYRISQLFTVC
jgi:hypothetical protein